MTFYKELSKYYDIVFKTGENQMALITSLIEEGSRILDIGSGTGTYTIPLAKLGYRMVALDNDHDMIGRLRQKSDALNLEIESFARDMLGLDDLIEDAYDGILCIGNTLPHLKNLSEVETFLRIVYDKLADGGVFIIQTINYDWVYNENISSLPLIDRVENGVRFERTYKRLDDDSLEFIGTLSTPDGRVSEASTKLLGLRLNHIEEGLEKAGFEKSIAYGGFDKKDWSIDSYATVIVAYKTV